MGCCESKMELPMKPVGLEGLYTFHDSKYNDGTDDIVVDELHHGLTNLKKQPPKSCLRTPPRSARESRRGERGGGGRGRGVPGGVQPGAAEDPQRPRLYDGGESGPGGGGGPVGALQGGAHRAGVQGIL